MNWQSCQHSINQKQAKHNHISIWFISNRKLFKWLKFIEFDNNIHHIKCSCNDYPSNRIIFNGTRLSNELLFGTLFSYSVYFRFSECHSKWQHRKKALKNIDDSQWCPICFMIDKNIEICSMKAFYQSMYENTCM